MSAAGIIIAPIPDSKEEFITLSKSSSNAKASR